VFPARTRKSSEEEKTIGEMSFSICPISEPNNGKKLQGDTNSIFRF
jgi:hypothetical protein